MLRKDPAFDAAVDLLLKPDDYRKIVQTNGPSMTTSQ
jgi:hypothetical protein